MSPYSIFMLIFGSFLAYLYTIKPEVDPGSYVYFNAKITQGTPIRVFGEMDAISCMNLCSNNPSCWGFQYDPCIYFNATNTAAPVALLRTNETGATETWLKINTIPCKTCPKSMSALLNNWSEWICTGYPQCGLNGIRARWMTVAERNELDVHTVLVKDTNPKTKRCAPKPCVFPMENCCPECTLETIGVSSRNCIAP